MTTREDMLKFKWLVNKGPPQPTVPPKEVLTDDPLATLRLKHGSAVRNNHVYAVSRINPLFEDEEVEFTSSPTNVIHEQKTFTSHTTTADVTPNSNHLKSDSSTPPDSPPPDTQSVRSSGYGSKSSVSGGSDHHDDSQSDEDSGSHPHHQPSPPPEFSDKKPSLLPSEENVLSLQNSSQTVAKICKSFEDLNDPKITEVTSSPSSSSFSQLVRHPSPKISIVSQDSNFVKSISIGTVKRSVSLDAIPKGTKQSNDGSLTVPRPVWPKVNNLANDFTSKTKSLEIGVDSIKSSYVPRKKEDNPQIFKTRSQILRFNPQVDVVSKNEHYVTDITVSPKATKNAPRSHVTSIEDDVPDLGSDNRLSSYFQSKHPPNLNPDFTLMSLQPDSLVNEHTLKLMDYSKQKEEEEDESLKNKPISVITVPPATDFTQVMYTRGLYATLNRVSSLRPKDIAKPPRRNSVNISSLIDHKPCAKKKGMDTVRGLWEKSGLKTNGRKLLTDINDLINDLDQDAETTPDTNFSIVETNNKNRDNSLLYSQHKRQHSSLSSYHTYEDMPEHSRKSSTSTTEAKSSATYFEIPDTEMGIVNPLFNSDEYSNPSSNSVITSHLLNKVNEKDKMKQFEKKMLQKLEYAPMHRKQWIKRSNSEEERKVTFTPSSSQGAVNYPGVAQRQESQSHSKQNTLPPQEGEQRGIWTTTESYHNRYNDSKASLSRNNRRYLWESYYGATGNSHLDNTLPRTFGRSYHPHPNSEAFTCATGTCQDFTLDMTRSVRLMKTSEARDRRRRCYIWLLVMLALLVFIVFIIAISWYCTNGAKTFGPM